MSNITSDIVKKVAKLSSLSISSDEEKVYTDQLSKILDYVDVLQSVDTSKIDPTYNTTGLENILREDGVKESLEQGVALNNAPNKKEAMFSHRQGLFVTKGVFGEK